METANIVEETLVNYSRVWLITWEWTGDHAKVDDIVIAILDYRYSNEKIERFVKWIYMSKRFSLAEQVAIAKNRKYNPYRVQYGMVEVKASTEAGLSPALEDPSRIVYGSNPCILARIVHDITAFTDTSGKQHFRFKEPRFPRREKGEHVSDWHECEIIR